MGLPRWRSGKESICQCRRCRRCGFHPWAGKNPWRRKWQPTLVFLPREFHSQGFLVGHSPWGPKKSDTTEQLTLSLHFNVEYRVKRFQIYQTSEYLKQNNMYHHMNPSCLSVTSHFNKKPPTIHFLNCSFPVYKYGSF